MNIMTKRLLSLLLAAVMCVSLLPVPVRAEGSESAETAFRTEETAWGVVITGLQESQPGEVLEIPEKLNGKQVYRIEAGAFRGTAGVRRVIIPASVSQLGDEAFRDCADLLNAEFLGEAPNVFGKDVFLHCAKDFAMWHRGGKAQTYCVLHGYPYYYKPAEFSYVYHSYSGKSGKNSVETVPTKVALSDSLFERTASELNYDLARLSLCFAMASSVNLKNGGSVKDVEKYDCMVGYDAEGSAESGYNRPDRFLRQCMETAGFTNDYYQYRYSDTTSEENDESYGIAWKHLDNGTDLVAVVIRSNGYGGGWVSNVTVSGGDFCSKGFYESARSIVYGGTESAIPVSGGGAEQNLGLLPYLEKNGLSPENTRLWVSGFSRGGAVANCIGGILQQESDYNSHNDNLMVYTFATPRTVDGNTAAAQSCPSVFNIVQEMDLVPQMPLQGWGFSRFGVTYALPCRSLFGQAYYSRLSAADSAFTALMKRFGRTNRYTPIDAQEQIVDELTKIMYAGVPDVANYGGEVEDSLQSLCSVTIAKNPGEVDTGSLISYMAGENAVEDLTSLYKRVIVKKEKLTAKEMAGYARRLKGEMDAAPLKALFSEVSSYALKLVVYNAYDKAKGLVTGNRGEATEIEKTMKYASNLYTMGFDSEALMQHWPEEYYAWLNSGTAEDTLTTAGYIRYCGKCPIDITVYDEAGKIVAQVVNEKITVSDLAVLTGLDGEKTVIIPEDQHYRVETLSRESGATMDVTVERCTFEGELVQKDIYLSVPLTEGEKFTAEVEAEGIPALVTDSGETVEPDRTLYEEELCTVEVAPDGEGMILGGGSYLVGDTVTLVAVPEDNHAFMGWTDENGELLSPASCFKFTANGSRSFAPSFKEIPTLSLKNNLLTMKSAGDTVILEPELSDESWLDQLEWVVTDSRGNVDEEHPQINAVISVTDDGKVTAHGTGAAYVEVRLKIGEVEISARTGVNVGFIYRPRKPGTSW